MPRKKSTKISFEKSLTQLEDIVEKMENGKLTLEQSLAYFESGIELSQLCQKALSHAEQKVDILIEKNGALQTEPFDFETQKNEDEFDE